MNDRKRGVETKKAPLEGTIMENAECDAVARVEPLGRVSGPRNNMAGNDEAPVADAADTANTTILGQDFAGPR